MLDLNETCPKHCKPYQLIGVDAECELDCRICLDCLRLDGGHKRGMSNHETISLEQLNTHFARLHQHSQDPINQCHHAIHSYFNTFESLLR